MTTELQTTEQHWTPEQVGLIKRTICKDATDDELKLFMHVCKRTGLDPFARQIYAIKRKDNKTGRENMVVQTSIDGFRLVASKTDAYAGSDDPVLDNENEPNKATVTIYKMVQGQRCAFTASARWNEYYPGDGPAGFMWRKMPCVMLSKVAEALALRKAFPADLSGIYAKEEMDQAGPPEGQAHAETRAEVPKPQPKPIEAKAVPHAVTGDIKKSRASIGFEIVAISKKINLSNEEREKWIFDLYKTSSKQLSLENMENFLEVLQKELGMSQPNDN